MQLENHQEMYTSENHVDVIRIVEMWSFLESPISRAQVNIDAAEFTAQSMNAALQGTAAHEEETLVGKHGGLNQGVKNNG